MRLGLVVVLVACGGGESISPAPSTPIPAAAAPPPAPCVDWRYALITDSFDPVENITKAELSRAWEAGEIAASPETIAALAPTLGDGKQVVPLASRPEPSRARRALSRAPGTAAYSRAPGTAAYSRAIIPAHELSPVWKLVTVDGAHPLTDAGALVARACGPKASNIDRAKLSTVVMSGTTALTRRTAQRIDDHSAQDLVHHIAPWFRSADITHVSNEVSFLRDCDPQVGPSGDKDELIFCAKDKYIEALEALGTDIVELTGSHLTDYGSITLKRTVEMYRKRGWAWFGGGRTQLESTEPRILEHGGHRFAFLGCNAVGTWLHAVSRGTGVAACDWPRMTWQIRDLRRRGLLPIVTVQHQETHEHDVPPGLVTDLRRLAEAGAMFVLGSQAHSAHPWDVHHGAYVHYGPGNTLFAQYVEAQREAAVDKLYVHDGKLLAVDHLYIRTEKGRPRPLTDRERARFLGQMEKYSGKYAASDPWAVPTPATDDRVRPDSLVVEHGRVQQLTIHVPARLSAELRYPLVVDLVGTATAADDAFVVSPIGKLRATGPEIANFIHAKYPVDPEKTSITPAPKRKRSDKRRHR